MSKKGRGTKYDKGKAPLDLIPYEALEEIAQVLSFGKNKYGRAQWINGIEYSRLISAALRHLNQFNSGEDIDDESKLNHIAHSATNLCFLLWMITNKPELDDRWNKKTKVKDGIRKAKKKSS